MLNFKINKDEYGKLRVVKYDESNEFSELEPYNFETIVEFIRKIFNQKLTQIHLGFVQFSCFSDI